MRSWLPVDYPVIAITWKVMLTPGAGSSVYKNYWQILGLSPNE